MSQPPLPPPHLHIAAAARYPCGARGIVTRPRPAAMAVERVSRAPGAIVIARIQRG